MAEKRIRRLPLRGGSWNHKQETPVSKQGSPGGAGNGTKWRDRIPTGMPGTPRGKCVGPEAINRGESCHCGRFNPKTGTHA